MKKQNVIIKDISYYHPQNAVSNDYFIEHFDKQGKDIRPLLEVTGRNQRYISTDIKETVLTMGVQAAKSVIEKAGITANEIDLIAFSTGTPEYVSPTNALKIHHAIGGKEKTVIYDMNSNCAGMIVALEQVSRYMRDNKNIRYALIVGSDQLNRYARPTEEITYSNFADSACAVILENVEDTDRGFIDSDFYTNSSLHENIVLPAKGMSSVIHDKELHLHDKLVEWIPFNVDDAFKSAENSIKELLSRNNLDKKDIRKYFLSQFAKKNIDSICENLEENKVKFTYVGDEFGYTGTTSPFLALAKAIENKEIDRSDYMIFWTVGAGVTCPCVLYKY